MEELRAKKSIFSEKFLNFDPAKNMFISIIINGLEVHQLGISIIKTFAKDELDPSNSFLVIVYTVFQLIEKKSFEIEPKHRMRLSELQRICLSCSLAFVQTIHTAIAADVKLFGSNYRAN